MKHKRPLHRAARHNWGRTQWKLPGQNDAQSSVNPPWVHARRELLQQTERHLSLTHVGFGISLVRWHVGDRTLR